MAINCIFLAVPENCEVTSSYFTIKKIAQFSPVVEASSLVAWLAFCTLITEFIGLKILK